MSEAQPTPLSGRVYVGLSPLRRWYGAPWPVLTTLDLENYALGINFIFTTLRRKPAPPGRVKHASTKPTLQALLGVRAALLSTRAWKLANSVRTSTSRCSGNHGERALSPRGLGHYKAVHHISFHKDPQCIQFCTMGSIWVCLRQFIR